MITDAQNNTSHKTHELRMLLTFPTKESSDHSVTLKVDASTSVTALQVPLFSPCGRRCEGRLGLALEYGSRRMNLELAASSGFLPLNI